jgi:hypothetical protein
VERLARLGMVAQSLLYSIVAVLPIRVALDQGGKTLEDVNEVGHRWIRRTGLVGHLARGVVFGLGAFLVKAALEYDPDEAIGIDGALQKLALHSYGDALLGLVAAGLLAYGVFCLVRARYREV